MRTPAKATRKPKGGKKPVLAVVPLAGTSAAVLGVLNEAVAMAEAGEVLAVAVIMVKQGAVVSHGLDRGRGLPAPARGRRAIPFA